LPNRPGTITELEAAVPETIVGMGSPDPATLVPLVSSKCQSRSVSTSVGEGFVKAFGAVMSNCAAACNPSGVVTWSATGAGFALSAKEIDRSILDALDVTEPVWTDGSRD